MAAETECFGDRSWLALKTTLRPLCKYAVCPRPNAMQSCLSHRQTYNATTSPCWGFQKHSLQTRGCIFRRPQQLGAPPCRLPGMPDFVASSPWWSSPALL